MKFSVWDELNGSAETAHEVEADDAEEAAIAYAGQDSDGMGDGLYTKEYRELHNVGRDGHPIMVMDGANVLRRFRVGVVEFEAVWGAAEVPVLP